MDERNDDLDIANAACILRGLLGITRAAAIQRARTLSPEARAKLIANAKFAEEPPAES